MKRVRVSKRIFLALLFGILLSADSVWARTRDEVLDSAKVYADLLWKPTIYNLLDVKNHRDNLTEGDETKIDGSDGIDDRAFKWNSKDTPPRWRYSKSNWPFEVCSTCTYHGEAYALSIDDTTTTFKNKLEEKDGEKSWIAGSVGDEVLPGGYLGFAGIDCSRFASQLIKLDPTTWTKELKAISRPISYKDLKKGDWLFRTDLGHVLIFADEKFEDQSNINIVHSVSWAYGWSEHVRRVIEDNSDVVFVRDRHKT